MGDAHTWLSQFSGALELGLRLALPVVAMVAGAGLLASLLQTLIGYGDTAVGFGLRLVATAVGLVLFGGWMAATMVGYWQEVGRQAAHVLGAMR